MDRGAAAIEKFHKRACYLRESYLSRSFSILLLTQLADGEHEKACKKRTRDAHHTKLYHTHTHTTTHTL